MNPTYAEFSRVLVVAAGVFLSIGLWSQVAKMFRTKSTKDFATVTVISWLVAELSWLNYGIVIGEWPVIVLGISNVPASIAAIIGFFLYRE